MNKRKGRLESFYRDIVHRHVCRKYGCVTVSELNFGGPKFDLVGFSPKFEEFYIVECKREPRDRWVLAKPLARSWPTKR